MHVAYQLLIIYLGIVIVLAIIGLCMPDKTTNNLPLREQKRIVEQSRRQAQLKQQEPFNRKHHKDLDNPI